MQRFPLLALACVLLSGGCATPQSESDPVIPAITPLQAAPRGIVGEPCPPALAAKAYC